MIETEHDYFSCALHNSVIIIIFLQSPRPLSGAFDLLHVSVASEHVVNNDACTKLLYFW